MIILTSDKQGCAYSIDSEGTLYYTPMYIGGGIETQDWVEVEPVDELDEEDVNVIHEKLIAMNKAIGEYYQK